MRKIILALSICALVPAVSIAVAYADDDEIQETRGVGQRMSCADIKAEIDSLNSVQEIDEDGILRLEKLQTDYRAKCTKRASGRSTGRVKVQVVEGATDVESIDKKKKKKSADVVSSCDTPDSHGCCPGEKYTDLGEQGFNCCTENNEHCFPPMEVKKDFSLCDDGTNPDTDGCCAGETYTDLGDLGWNCCMADGVTCFPPIKK